MKKAAIVSGNVELIRFFELELRLYGYGFDVFSSSDGVTEDYAFCALDTALEEMSSEKAYATKTVAVSWPVSLLDIRELCLDAVENHTSATASDKRLPAVAYSVDGQGQISLFGTQIKLSMTEYSVLCALCEANGEIVRREDLMSLLNAHEGNVADVYVCNLRKKLSLATEKRVILTERGKGYRTHLKLIK